MPTVPGAIGAFRRRALDEVGRLLERHPGRGHRHHDRARARRLAGRLRRGRARLHRGALDALRRCGASATAGPTARCRRSGSTGAPCRGASQEGRIGRSASPTCCCSRSLLPLLAPLIDVFALYGVVFLDPLPILAYWVGFNAPAAAARRLRLPARRRAAAAALGDAAAAVRLSPADVPGRDPVGDQRGARRRGCAGSTSSAPARSRSPGSAS